MHISGARFPVCFSASLALCVAVPHTWVWGIPGQRKPFRKGTRFGVTTGDKQFYGFMASSYYCSTRRTCPPTGWDRSFDLKNMLYCPGRKQSFAGRCGTTPCQGTLLSKTHLQCVLIFFFFLHWAVLMTRTTFLAPAIRLPGRFFKGQFFFS